ncbi:MAG: hypothetical protein K2K48_06640 [Anaeroplasmataceae bacterium]|nr:hypothetical protein [Anaeroplasmataceae bacterium]MDE6415076.1 hypothetical protein [Anaeroplasmataceae bacterium]
MKKLTILGVLVVFSLGTLFHFMYEWVPFFIFPMNESIFEHCKLVLFPFLIFYLCCLPFYKENKGVLFSSFFSAILVSIAIIVIGYYTYSGILGYDIDAVNIILYYVAVLIGFLLIYKKKTFVSISNSVVFLLIMIVLFSVFSFYPPNLSFFKG